MIRAALIIAMLALAGCATSPIPIGLPCSVGPIALSKGASTRLTDAEQRQILEVNLTGESLCRWKAPN